jgi:MoaA/NifB/PqqE/SkfB family radical SAM enzyme
MGVIHLTKKPNIIQRAMYSPLLAQVVVTRRCNLRCGYCNEFDRKSDPVDESVLVSRIDKLKELGTFGIEFTGGEPLLHPAIFRIIAHAKTLRFITRWIITNAFLLDNDGIDRLNDSGLTDMQISIDGVKPNEVTVKVLDKLRDKLVLLSQKAKFRVTVSAVVGAAPPEEVWEVVRFAKSLKFRPRVLLLHDETGCLKLSPEEVSLYQELQTQLGKRSKESKNYRNLLIQGKPAPFKCRAGSRYLYVDEHGMAHMCSQTVDKFSKELLNYSVDDLKDRFYKYKSCNSYCTIGCARTASKLDEWRSQSKE